MSYVPWAFVDNHQLVTGWPAGHDNGQTLVDLTVSMYNYHNDLPNPHAASSPWWAWALDLKPVWFYEQGFAGSTSASIYDAGNLVAWWLAVPGMAFVAWQAFRRRSPALALIAIAFACQWISWARIDRAAFQYHYYTALPFLFLALAYFLAELWHGTSRRIWLLARLSAGVAVLGPFLLWLLHRPLCAIVRVEDVNPGSQACPTLIPDVDVTPRAVALAIVMGVGVLLLLRELLAVTEEDEPAELEDDRAAGGWRAALARLGLGGRWATVGRDRRRDGGRVPASSTRCSPTSRASASMASRSSRSRVIVPAGALAGRGVRGHGARFATVRGRRGRRDGLLVRPLVPEHLGAAAAGGAPQRLPGLPADLPLPVPVLGEQLRRVAAVAVRDRAGDHARLAAVHDRGRRVQRLVVADRDRRAPPRPAGRADRAAALGRRSGTRRRTSHRARSRST